MMFTKIDGYYAKKIRFWKNHTGQATRNAKRDEKTPFRQKSGDLDFQGHYDYAPMVTAGDHGEFSPSGCRLSTVFQAFFVLLSPVFFLTLFLTY